MADKQPKSDTAAEVADTQDNVKLEHTRGGTTTRDDLLDAGVPMLQGDPKEPVGPEDALGAGPKRGDYRERVVGEPHTSEPIPEDEQVPGGPTARLVAQRPRTEEIGDDAGRKGGVETG